jgi:hypothetical protein
LQATRGETVREWVNTAPKAEITFALWDGDLPATDYNRDGALPLSQGFYGYLDLSHLPADAFPIKLRLLYDAPIADDVASSHPGILSQLKDTASAGPGLVVEETYFASPSDAQAVPVWNAPLPVPQLLGYNYQESVRAEIQSRNGTLLGRLLIGASAPPWGRPHAVLVNTPGANQAFAKASYRTVAEVKRLVPDSYAYANVDTIWIDAASASDPTLSDAFWQQILLGGTTVAGRPDEIGILAKRLGLTPNEPVLTGGLVAAESPEAFTQAQGQVRDLSGNFIQVNGANPFALSAIMGAEMHRQLLHFSEFYLGIFLVLQTIVIIAAFLCLRGTRRVWLWLVVPGFAFIYTVAGIALSHVMVQARSDGRLEQVELRREGWPQALLLTHLKEISLADRETVLDLPSGSRPFIPLPADFFPSRPYVTSFFRHDADMTRLTVHSRPATKIAADIRSLLSSKPPCEFSADGMLNARRNFSGAWLWDGANWHDLGRLYQGQQIYWKTFRIIQPSTSMTGRVVWDEQGDDDFPSTLKPLLNDDTLKALSSAGEGLFLGVEPVADVQIENAVNDRMASRRVVAYQFHMKGATP